MDKNRREDLNPGLSDYKDKKWMAWILTRINVL